MLNELETERGWDGDDVQVRIPYDMNAFAEKETASHLDILHYYWSSLQLDDVSVPKISEFHIEDVLPESARNYVAWVDTSSEDPNNFIMRRHPQRPNPGFGVELTNRNLSEFPNKMHSKSLVLEYLRCKRWRSPLYHDIDQVINGVARHYTRLLLPLVSESGEVTRIFYGFNPLIEPAPLYIAD
jgi:hypothetical protein